MKKRTAIQAIKVFCRECQGVPKGGDYTPVKECRGEPGTPYECPLYPFRLGKNPNRRPKTEEERLKLGKRLEQARSGDSGACAASEQGMEEKAS